MAQMAGSLSHLEEVVQLLQRVQPHELLYEYTMPAATDSSAPAIGPAHSTDHKASSDLSSAAAPSTIVKSRPCVRFASAVDRDNLYVRFEVQESRVRATHQQLYDPVYEDSCVEVFVRAEWEHVHTAASTTSKTSLPAQQPLYYNFEFSCIGTLLAEYGVGRHDRKRQPIEILQAVHCVPSLGRVPFGEVDGHPSRPWTLTACIPKIAFGVPAKVDLTECALYGNAYKCGDKLTGCPPHWLSLFPIETDRPNFHRPDAFQLLKPLPLPANDAVTPPKR